MKTVEFLNWEMKIFTLIREYFMILGIRPRKPNESRLNCRNAMAMFSFVQLFIMTTTFFLFKAKTFREYAECFYGCVTALLNFVNFAIIVFWKTDKIFRTIDHFEEVIQKREYHFNPVFKGLHHAKNVCPESKRRF